MSKHLFYSYKIIFYFCSVQLAEQFMCLLTRVGEISNFSEPCHLVPAISML